MNDIDLAAELIDRSKPLVRATSRAVYQEIVERRLLSKARERVWLALYDNGPLTAQELDQLLGQSGYWKRLSELRDCGVVKEIGVTSCRVTGRTAILWDVTDRLPKNIDRITRPPTPSKKEMQVVLDIFQGAIDDFDRDNIPELRKMFRWMRWKAGENYGG